MLRPFARAANLAMRQDARLLLAAIGTLPSPLRRRFGRRVARGRIAQQVFFCFSRRLKYHRSQTAHLCPKPTRFDRRTAPSENETGDASWQKSGGNHAQKRNRHFTNPPQENKDDGI